MCKLCWDYGDKLVMAPMTDLEIKMHKRLGGNMWLWRLWHKWFCWEE